MQREGVSKDIHIPPSRVLVPRPSAVRVPYPGRLRVRPASAPDLYTLRRHHPSYVSPKPIGRGRTVLWPFQ